MRQMFLANRDFLECAIAGRYQIADGRDFWIDGVVAREIATRIKKASERNIMHIKTQQPHEHDWRYASLYTRPGFESRARCEICGERKWDIVGFLVEDDAEGQWKPIDTAPKDGSLILVYEKGAISSKRWIPGYSDWAHEFPGIPGNSHWMPLPPAPGEEKRGA